MHMAQRFTMYSSPRYTVWLWIPEWRSRWPKTETANCNGRRSGFIHFPDCCTMHLRGIHCWSDVLKWADIVYLWLCSKSDSVSICGYRLFVDDGFPISVAHFDQVWYASNNNKSMYCHTVHNGRVWLTLSLCIRYAYLAWSAVLNAMGQNRQWTCRGRHCPKTQHASIERSVTHHGRSFRLLHGACWRS